MKNSVNGDFAAPKSLQEKLLQNEAYPNFSMRLTFTIEMQVRLSDIFKEDSRSIKRFQEESGSCLCEYTKSLIAASSCSSSIQCPVSSAQSVQSLQTEVTNEFTMNLYGKFMSKLCLIGTWNLAQEARLLRPCSCAPVLLKLIYVPILWIQCRESILPLHDCLVDLAKHVAQENKTFNISNSVQKSFFYLLFGEH